MQWSVSVQRCWMGILVTSGLFGFAYRSHGEPLPTAMAQVYECRIDGQRVFSDQPCATGAARREVITPNRMSAQEAAIGYRSSSSSPAKRKSAPEPASNSKRQARCAALLKDKTNLVSRLRTGYTNNQGERLRDRLRKVDSQYYDLRCSAL